MRPNSYLYQIASYAKNNITNFREESQYVLLGMKCFLFSPANSVLDMCHRVWYKKINILFVNMTIRPIYRSIIKLLCIILVTKMKENT